MTVIKDDIIRAYTLKNAIEHEGKAALTNVLSPLFHEGLEPREVKEIMPNINSIIKDVNSLSFEDQNKEFDKLKELISHRPEREGLQELPGAKKGKVITRIAPSPSGPMHIGHAATGMPSSLYAKQFDGKFIVRIEDTNPDNIYPPAYNMIPSECDWVFGNVYEYLIQSERNELYYEYIQKLIEKESAYVCDCDPEYFKELIKKQKSCPCRLLELEENLKRWKKMLDKKGYRQGEAVLRFKSDLSHPNPAMRDFPLARINTTPHPRQGKKYRVWPLMNLSVFVDDLETGVTHAIRAKEHQDAGLRQEMMFKVFDKEPPVTIYMGRYNFTDLEISASKTKEKIEKGLFTGWDDIRLPFLTPLMRRGFQPEAFKEMAIQRGVSDVDKKLTKEEYFELLNNFNREIIKDKAKELPLTEENNIDAEQIILKMPTGEKKELYTENTNFKDGDLVYLEKIGYARYNSIDNCLWFAHN